VTAVLGPREESTGAAILGGTQDNGKGQTSPMPGIAISKDGGAARFVVILDHEPLGGVAIQDLQALEERMPELARQAGLGSVQIGFAGDTALADDTVQQTLDDLGRIALATVLVDLILLVMFLRSLVAPLYLLGTSVLALLASLGITTWVVQGVFGYDHLTYYVPFAAAVLLVALGSDYNIFIVGRMWEEAKARPLREAIAIGARRATRPITLAGLTLAGSFALLALVPVRPFRELALAMSVGVLLDSFVVRSLLVPSLVSLFGRSSFWPGRVPQTAEAAQQDAA
jgi:RND superfamily putative drug exporter